MSLFWGIVLAGIGAYTMRASFVGPAVMAALVVTTLTGTESQLEAGLIEFLTLAVMAGVTLWRNDLLIGLFTALVVFFVSNSLFG
jgi:branched-subunit amino acid transport protein AzlD